jgi:hypothetical protein
MGRAPVLRKIKRDKVRDLIIELEPIRPQPPDEEDRRYRRQKAYSALLMVPVSLIAMVGGPILFASWWGFWGLILGIGFSVFMIFTAVFACVMWWFISHDTRIIPTDPVYMPPPMTITREEEWRKPTAVRYLEDVKDFIDQMEQKAISLYKRTHQAFENLGCPDGYFEYEAGINRIKSFQKFCSDYERLKESANRVYNGEVNAEINELQTAIRQLQRERQEMEGHYDYIQRKVQETQGKIAIALTGVRSEQIKRNLKDIDLEIITLESYISELKQVGQHLIEVKAKPTAAGQREYIANLKRKKAEEVAAMKDAGERDEDVRRRENNLDDAIAVQEEKLRELL